MLENMRGYLNHSTIIDIDVDEQDSRKKINTFENIKLSLFTQSLTKVTVCLGVYWGLLHREE